MRISLNPRRLDREKYISEIGQRLDLEKSRCQFLAHKPSQRKMLEQLSYFYTVWKDLKS